NPQVSASVIEALGLLLTAWRIFFRLKIHRFWWEDAWAAVLLPTGLLSVASYWMELLKNGSTAIVGSWFYSICFTCIVTLSRMSVLFSIIRIIHGSPRLGGFTYACVAFFATCWVILIVYKVWQCDSDPSWHQPSLLSSKPYSDCIAVLILVVLHLRMLWRVKLPRRQRRMILSIFASSVVLAFGALFHIVGQIMNNLVLSTAGMHVEIALSIIVCNLLVVVTYTYQFLLHDSTGTTEDISTSNDDDFTMPPRPRVPATTLALTTVDLPVCFTSTGQQTSSKSGTI
ncbi:hypothetical protein OG21DRAFT_1408671, partial [Imleria badia]